MKFTIPKEEYMGYGNLGCQGCSGTLALRYALKALGKDTAITMPACCLTIVVGQFPYTCLKVPILHTAFETTACMASGMVAGLRKKGKKTIVLARAGDGGTFDIGIQALSGSVERNDDFIYVCYDNEAYMNTGIQRSSATPYGAWTTTTPRKKFKLEQKKNMIEIMVAHRIPYTATANVAYPEDFIRKLNIAKSIVGTKYIQIFCPCPTGWRYEPEKTIELARLAVNTQIYPLYEVKDGKYKINIKTKNKSVMEYIKMQGRFDHLHDEEIKNIQEFVDREWNLLLKKEEFSKV